ncbi:hypothetical protein FACS1894202_06860 [Clostridia bacterium]|nr:hypothetical protein FACS1894202_06860 [Clostridia bacterium]
MIPIYQREYKWDKPKIQCLIRDIANHEKFLGIIILDENDTAHEIVDGQQRVTTCFLILMAMYNLYVGQPREQQNILNLMQPYNHNFVLSNDSVGDYISISGGEMSFCIAPANDMFFQTDKFTTAYEIIFAELSAIKDNNALRKFQEKLRDCEVLVMVNEAHADTKPIEQVFLDINEKSQLLDVEDIFKGHCFEKFTDDTLHQGLRQLWANLKRIGIQFGDFGYKDLSQYLYHYLLENFNKELPEDLSPKGTHILTGKTMDETEKLLKNMIEYGEKALEFRTAIGESAYRFANICVDAQSYCNTNNHALLKRMAIEILDTKSSLYQKLPFFEMIHALHTREFGNSLTHDTLKRIFTNIYVYSSLFVIRGGRKSKGDIDLTIKEALSAASPVQAIVCATKRLRQGLVDKFEFKANFKAEALEFVYSIIDFYNANQNWLTYKYTRGPDTTLEHFIIPNNRDKRVKWRSQTDFDFVIANNYVGDYKKRAYNYVFLPQKLNEKLEHDDIISKISNICDWYNGRNEAVPKHVKIFTEHIQTLPTYQEILMHKDVAVSRDDIESGYNNFIEEYFSEEKQSLLSAKIQRAFKEAFSNVS